MRPSGGGAAYSGPKTVENRGPMHPRLRQVFAGSPAVSGSGSGAGAQAMGHKYTRAKISQPTDNINVIEPSLPIVPYPKSYPTRVAP